MANDQPSRSLPTDPDELLSSLLNERPVLRRYIARRLHSSQDVEDYVQEVYARVLAAAPRNKFDSVRGFLLRVASNLLIDQRRRSRSRMHDQHVALEERDHPDDGGANSPERVVIAREQLAAMQDRLNALDPVSREIFRLVRLEGLSHRQAAARLGLEVKAVSRRLEGMLVQLARAASKDVRR